MIVDLVVAGKLNKEIAFVLNLSPATIKAYMSRILSKTGTSNRTELAVWRVRKLGDRSSP